jgi:hypothetical protein
LPQGDQNARRDRHGGRQPGDKVVEPGIHLPVDVLD